MTDRDYAHFFKKHGLVIYIIKRDPNYDFIMWHNKIKLKFLLCSTYTIYSSQMPPIRDIFRDKTIAFLNLRNEDEVIRTCANIKLQADVKLIEMSEDEWNDVILVATKLNDKGYDLYSTMGKEFTYEDILQMKETLKRNGD